ncbi:IS3 family transposase [Emticicia agri]|uniref:IS3 family transposase n=1 Tax=Emticicia agri TaxID=2492393 RepID=A0A4Q5LJP7_9BACT|nr:IS3 family transposase [Emticicia agri]
MYALKEAKPAIGLGQICRMFGITRQAYYQYFWRANDCLIEEELLIQKVNAIRQRQPMIGTRKLYGMLQAFMIEHQIKMGRDALFDLLSQHGLLVRRRNRKTKTTFSSHWLRKYPNLIKDIEPIKPNQIWASDITYLETNEGFVYLSLITDTYSRKIMGYHIADNLLAISSVEALKMALKSLPQKVDKLIHHSDRGIQYCSHEYVTLLQDYGLQISMTQNGNPLENAIAERVNGILKDEFLAKIIIKNLSHAQGLLREIIEIYNKERPHMSVGLLTPEQAHQMEGKLERYWKNYYTNKGCKPMAGLSI